MKFSFTVFFMFHVTSVWLMTVAFRLNTRLRQSVHKLQISGGRGTGRAYYIGAGMYADYLFLISRAPFLSIDNF